MLRVSCCQRSLLTQLAVLVEKRSLRHRINPKTFVITFRQIAKHLKVSQERILNWEKWHNVLWVQIKGLGGYFVSYRKLEQWIAACQTSIGSCRNLDALNNLRHLILQEAKRYTTDALSRLEALWQKRYADLCSRQQLLSNLEMSKASD